MKLFRSGQSSSFSNVHLGKCTTNLDGEEGVLAISVGILFWIGALPAVGDAIGDHRVARFLAEVRSRKWQKSVSARNGAVEHIVTEVDNLYVIFRRGAERTRYVCESGRDGQTIIPISCLTGPCF